MRSRPLGLLACLVSLLVPTAPPARGLQAGGTWEVVPSPNTGSPNNQFNGVAAIAPDDVWAVGTYGTLGIDSHPVIQHWDGVQWTVADALGLPEDGELTAVSAVSADDIWAVGFSLGKTHIQHWDGAAWSVQASPSPGLGNVLFGVSAAASDDVWAVGSVDDGGLSRTLVEHWDGSTWSVIPSPNVANQHNKLTGVAAVPGSPDVWAVGDASPFEPLIMRWNGTQWSIVPTPDAGNVPHLTGVVALSENDVWAVGWTGSSVPSSGPITLTMHWNGSTWSVVSSPSPGPTFNYLWGVGAAGPSDVWAVGYYIATGGDSKSLFLRWNGSSWTQIPGDDSGPDSLPISPIAVDGTSPNDVWSVGSNSHALVQHWNGVTWTQVPAPNLGVGSNILNAVSGSSPTDVWEVGYFGFGVEDRTLIHHWDGETLSLVPSPNTNKRLNVLNGVAAISPSDAWAVGDASSGELDQTTLILRWDGVAWSIVPSPSPGTAGLNTLRGVSAIAADDVWAVGGSWSGGPMQTVALHWNGTTWSVVPSANLFGTNTEFFGVAAIAPDDVWAVGYSGAFGHSTLVEHWDGLSWSIVPAPDNPLSSNVLRAVSASGPNDVWAVGTALNLLTSIVGTLTQHWDGREWSASFGVNAPFSTLYGVAAAAPDDAWQVGDLAGLALIGHWNGSTWKQYPSPPVAGRLHAATALSTCEAWAVGYRFDEELQEYVSLSEHYTADCDTVWTDVGFALAGIAGEPVLAGSGPLTPGSSGALTLTNAARSALSALFTSIGSAPVPFKGGTLAASPPALTLTLVTSQVGSIALNFSHWPAGLSGLELYFQYAIKDAVAVQGVALSNALEADVP